MTSAAALARAGVEVHVLAGRIDAEEAIPGITTHRWPNLFKLDAPPEVRIGEPLEVTADVIHMHQTEDPFLVSFMQQKAPVVISVHGYSACTAAVHYFRPGQECQRPHGLGCAPNLIARGCAHVRDPRPLPATYRRTTRRLTALRNADLAISYSSAVDRHLGINGVAPRRVIPLFATLVPEAGTEQPSARRVLFAGRIIEAKGVGVLIRAARAVDAEFVICGDGVRLPAMRRLAQRLGVAERVRFTGWLSARELARELARASVVALPSVWPEPFGLAGIEAFAAGRPVVASATGGTGDWLEDGVNGIAVKPGDAGELARALGSLLDDPERQGAMGAAGKAMAATRFTAERHVAALLDAYASAIGSPRVLASTGTPAQDGG
jgi:glycosyltransferase involved in cell wall biosynthesis